MNRLFLYFYALLALAMVAPVGAQTLDAIMTEGEAKVPKKENKTPSKVAPEGKPHSGVHPFLVLGEDSVWPPAQVEVPAITRNFFLDPRKKPPIGVAAIPIVMAKKELSVQDRLNKALQTQMEIWESIQQTVSVKAVVINSEASFMVLSNGESLVQGESLELSLAKPDSKKGKNVEVSDKVRLRLLRLLPSKAEVRLEAINGNELFRSESPVWVWQID